MKDRMIQISLATALAFFVLHLILNAFELELRNWLIWSVIIISTLLFSAGVFYSIFKIKKKAVKVITAILVSLLLLAAAPFVLVYGAFTYEPEHVVAKNGQKLVGYVTAFLDTYVTYYDYKNIFVRGTQMRLSEYYGSGSYDPLDEEHTGMTPKTSQWFKEEK